MFTMTTNSDSSVIFWSNKLDHFKVPLVLKINRNFCFTLGFYARVYGSLKLDNNSMMLLSKNP